MSQRYLKIVALAFLLTALVLQGGIAADADEPSPFKIDEAVFRPIWQADKCVQKRQSWDDYWYWIHVFYFGNAHDPGWIKDETSLLTKINSTARQGLLRNLAYLGRRIGGEWAKDNSCRKIRTSSNFISNLTEAGKPAIQDWGRDLVAAAALDSGDGAELQKTIDAITAQVDRILGAPPQ